MSTAIQLSNISKSYETGKTVLAPLELEIHPGELFFLLGPSGCGKSTLLRILAGLIEPDSGEIRFNGERIDRLPPEKRQAAMVFQSYALWPHMTVFDNIAFALKANGTPRTEIRKIVEETLAIVQLEEFADRKIPSLSGGQQQRVALARALAVKPAVLLLDEPLSNLDARLRDVMRTEIRRICKERNQTAIYVTHDRKEALSMSDRLAVLNQGAIQQLGSPREVYCRPRSKFVASFLGDGNFFRGKVTAPGVLANVESVLGALRVKWPEQLACEVGKEYDFMIRPETLHGTADGEENRIDGIIEKIEFMGECGITGFRTEAGMLLEMNELCPEERKIGEKIQCTIAAKDIVPMEVEA